MSIPRSSVSGVVGAFKWLHESNCQLLYWPRMALKLWEHSKIHCLQVMYCKLTKAGVYVECWYLFSRSCPKAVFASFPLFWLSCFCRVSEDLNCIQIVECVSEVSSRCKELRSAIAYQSLLSCFNGVRYLPLPSSLFMVVHKKSKMKGPVCVGSSWLFEYLACMW
jgi:hypothetical protein